jgi:hypothetical protein
MSIREEKESIFYFIIRSEKAQWVFFCNDVCIYDETISDAIRGKIEFFFHNVLVQSKKRKKITLQKKSYHSTI